MRGNGTFAPKVTYNDIGTGQTSMAVVDLNGDGLPDIITSDYYGGVEGHDVSVMMNLGNGTFGAPTFYGTSSGPFGVAVADLNGDGKPDIVTSNWDTGTISVLMGNGDGTFKPSVTVASAGNEAGSIAIADLKPRRQARPRRRQLRRRHRERAVGQRRRHVQAASDLRCRL